MTVDQTPRLGLFRETDDEVVDQFDVNWGVVDSKAGVLQIADGSTPAVGSTFDGQIFSEATSGKSYIAKWNPNTASYDKRWLTYPWCIEVQMNSVSIPVGANVKVFDQIRSPGANVNSSVADFVGGKVVVPIDGIYSVDTSVFYNATGSNYCYSDLVINNDVSATVLEYSRDFMDMMSSKTVVNPCRIVYMKKGWTVGLRIGHQHSAAINCTATCTVSLVSPT